MWDPRIKCEFVNAITVSGTSNVAGEKTRRSFISGETLII